MANFDVTKVVPYLATKALWHAGRTAASHSSWKLVLWPSLPTDYSEKNSCGQLCFYQGRRFDRMAIVNKACTLLVGRWDNLIIRWYENCVGGLRPKDICPFKVKEIFGGSGRIKSKVTVAIGRLDRERPFQTQWLTVTQKTSLKMMQPARERKVRCSAMATAILGMQNFRIIFLQPIEKVESLSTTGALQICFPCSNVVHGVIPCTSRDAKGSNIQFRPRRL